MTWARIEADQFYPHPPELVWRALTEADLLSQWLMPTDFRAEVGATFIFDAGSYGITRCRVLALDPGKRLRISWANDWLDTTVTWDLRAEGRGTRLVVVHDGFDPDDPRQRAAFEGMSGGWAGAVADALGRCLLRLAERVGAASDQVRPRGWR